MAEKKDILVGWYCECGTLNYWHATKCSKCGEDRGARKFRSPEEHKIRGSMIEKMKEILEHYFSEELGEGASDDIAVEICQDAFLPWVKQHSNMGTVMLLEDEIKGR